MGRLRRFAKSLRYKLSQRFNDTQSSLGATSCPSAQSVQSTQSTETTEVAASDDFVDYALLPEPPSQFISYLDRYQGDPTRVLLQPYIGYEKWLRHEFTNPNPEIDCHANLVPIFNGQENLLKIRAIDYESADKSRYLMPLQDHQREEDRSLAIVTSLEKYQCNFDGFTRGILAGLDWSNIVVAGSSALLPLLSRRKDVDIKGNHAVEKPAETYYQITASTSDVDIFFYGIDDEDAAVRRIIEVENVIRKNQKLSPNKGLTLRSENAITFIAPKWPFRHVQIILRLYKSISEILTGFDVDCSCVAFDGKQVYTNPRGVAAIATRTNTIDLTRRSPSYENRLWKYRQHNFEVYWDALDRKRLKDIDLEEYDMAHRNLTGLARLIFSEEVLKKEPGPTWKKNRNLRKLDDSTGPNMVVESLSGYTNHILPYGMQLTASNVRYTVINQAETPYMFGTIREVTDPTNRKCKWKLKNNRRIELTKKVTFIKLNPGRQMIGSFHPLTADDWTKMAYE
ncbi:uncharacterized protein F4812DRAFT_409879 [Daldinia caldariorum]|uniref:uncharacterized protein n=1 Tax=Daldinia caldariorum TaxID=326644 RepID=UPI002008A3AD|nr:uncharacterized protein F4812DRAFT_409879 [Daldinia caldariorum]KAI1472682.1 hypothetical protein F4812DRAFT_409879 [Daldinia caldariorum]